MNLFRSDITKELIKLGYKQVPGFNVWVHRKKDSVLGVSGLDGGWWGVVNIGVTTPSDQNRYKTINILNTVKPLHKLKALAFLELGVFKDILGDNYTYDDLLKNKIVVNHKDGNKLNNEVDNLEWVTYADNNVHAFVNGLRSDNYFGYCYDVMEEKEIPFYSINSLGKEINIHPDYISRYLKGPRNSFLAHRYLIRKEDESDYPVKLGKGDVWNSVIGGIKPVTVTNSSDNVTKEYAFLKDALKEIGKEYLSKKGLDLSKGIEVNGFIINPINDYEKIMSLKKIYIDKNKSLLIQNRQNRKPIPIIVTYPDGEEVYYDSLEILAKKYGVKKSRLKARILRYNGFWNNIHIRYISPTKAKVLESYLPELLENAQKSLT